MNAKISLLIVDDEAVYRRVLQREFERRGHSVATAASAEEGLELLKEQVPDVAVIDLRMAGAGGLGFLREVRARGLDTEVVVLTGFPSLETAVTALREGVFDYRTKPIDLDTLESVVVRAAERRALRGENLALRRALTTRESSGIATASPALQGLLQRLPRAATSASTVLIRGETGTGKELVAREVHRLSPRHEQPFVVIDCAALQPSVRASELFGCEKGAFTGAERARPGLFEAAHGGTVFLDEVGELDLESQAALLRVIESGEVRRVGSTRARPVDVRIVAATHRNLAEEVEAKRFRADLYFRLHVVELVLPPLRERREDVIPLFERFFSAHAAGALPVLTERARAALLDYAWPGNVRELRNVAEMLAVTIDGGSIDVADLPPQIMLRRAAAAGAAAPVALADVERNHLLAVFEQCGRNKRKTADALGISVRTLYYKLAQYGVAASP